MARSPKSVDRLLSDRPILKTIRRDVEAQEALLTLVRQCLPDDLVAHCLAARMHDRRLILHTDSPVWATRLRYLSRQLLSVMRHAEPALRDINVRVLIPRSASPRQQNAARKSDTAAAIIHECARFTKQASLRDALERLSRALKTHG